MNLTQREKDIIQQFKSEIVKRYPEDVMSIIVFGSKARGDASEESDIDIMVVTHSDNWRTGDKIRNIGYDLELKHNLVLSIQVVSKSHMDHLKKIRSQFMQNIERNGIAL